jgi:hypothetical protein
MQARPGPAFKPEDWQRGYSRDQIVAHLADALDIYGELDAGHEIAVEIRPLIFSIITTMTSALEPTAEALKKLGARQQILGAAPANGNASGLDGILGRG